jgi:UPF0176 protein
MPFRIIAFYHFFDFPHYASRRADILEFMKARDIKGSILIAAEGMNGTVAGSHDAIDALIGFLQRDIIGGGVLNYKESASDTPPFPRTKVRLKKETISLGEPANPHHVGEYVSAHEWNALIQDPDTIVLDTRNAYETHLGTFEGAIDPDIQNFKQLPAFIRDKLGDKKDAKIATFCTGGIRCEKLTSWMLDQGFKNVYHLQGGILKYLEDVPPEQSTWQGECYVFDKRIAVGHGLIPSQTATMCRCGHALIPEDRQHPAYVEGKSCAYCAG